MRKTIWIAIWALTALLILSSGFFLVACFYPIYQPKPFDEQRFDRIIAWMRTRKPGAKDLVVVLPPNLAALSTTGRAYITEDSVFIPSWIGRKAGIIPYGYTDGDDWIEGYVYSKQLLSVSPTNPSFGIMNVPGSCSPREAPLNSTVGDREMYVYQRIGRHWYTCDSFE